MSRGLYKYSTVLHEKILLTLGIDNSEDISSKPGLFSHKLDETKFFKAIEKSKRDFPTGFYADYGTALGYGYQTGVENSADEPNPYFIHLKLGYVLQLLNLFIPEDSKGSKLFTFNTTKKVHNFRTIQDHISIDPGVCILPRLQYFNQNTTAFRQSQNILDIFVSVDHVLNTLTSTQDNRGGVDLLSYVENLLNGIEDACGGINAFELQYFEEQSEFSVVDRNQVKEQVTYPKINLSGINSIVKDVNLVSKLSPSISAAIAISAQASPYSTGVESTGFQHLNKGIFDSVIPEKKLPDLYKYEEKVEDLDTPEQIQQAREDFIKDVKESIYKMYFTTINGKANTIQYNKENVRYFRTIFSNYYKLLIGLQNKPGYNFIIPFELELTLDGIAGLHVMEAFVINEEILPYTYRTKFDGSQIAYLITALEHRVSLQGWETHLRAQLFIAQDKPSVESAELFTGTADIQAEVVSDQFEDFVTSTPWSAAFIVYCVTARGISFPRSAAHTGYAQKVRRGGFPFVALDPATTKLERGDIILKNRAGNIMKYSSRTWTGYSHGDIVNNVSNTTASVIGGNLSNTVKAENISLVDGKLVNTNKGTNGSYFVVIRPLQADDARKIANEVSKQFDLIKSRVETDKSIASILDSYYKSANLTPPAIA